MLQVEKYQIRHEGEDYLLEPDNLREGKFRVKLKEKGAKIEARIKYHGYHNWTRWISSERKVNTALLYTRDLLSLLPVLIISFTVLSLLCVLTVCIVKKKRTELKYEEELAKHHQDSQELQKQLNNKYLRS